MKNKRNYFFIFLLVLLVIFSLCFTIYGKYNKKIKLNNKVNVTVNLYDIEDENSSVVANVIDTENSNSDNVKEYVEPPEDFNFVTKDDFYVSNEQGITSEKEEKEELDNINRINESNFVDMFTELLLTDLSTIDLNIIPITQNCYSKVGNFIEQDAYNNGFIILKAGFNTEENTFMCLIRTVNQRTYFKGTLIDGKIDTITSTVLK